MPRHERNGDVESDARQNINAEPQGAFTSRGPRGYRRSDSSIREDITECLTRDGQIDAGRIQITVEDGEVTLTGTILTREEKRLAEIAAEQCAGVKAIWNELRVHQPDSSPPDLCQPDISQEDNQQSQDSREGEWGRPQETPLTAARVN